MARCCNRDAATRDRATNQLHPDTTMNTRHVARITRLTLLLLAWLSVAVSASGQPIDPAQQQTGDRANDSPLRACEPRPGSASQAIRILEIRSMGRIEEDLALVDGINANRDVL